MRPDLWSTTNKTENVSLTINIDRTNQSAIIERKKSKLIIRAEKYLPNKFNKKI